MKVRRVAYYEAEAVEEFDMESASLKLTLDYSTKPKSNKHTWEVEHGGKFHLVPPEIAEQLEKLWYEN